MVELLLQNGADINAIDNADRTPLHWAAAEGMCWVVLCHILQITDLHMYICISHDQGYHSSSSICFRLNELIEITFRGVNWNASASVFLFA